MRSTGGIVLCGGQSSRMGRPKAWLSVGGETMLQRVVRTVGEVVGPVVVVAAPGQEVPPLPAGVRVVYEPRPPGSGGVGPLGGLAAGLAALAGECDAAYLSGCDVPMLRAEFVRRIVAPLSPGGRGVGGEGGQITIPLIAARLHPLAAVYSLEILPVVLSQLAANDLRMTILTELLPTQTLTEVDFAEVDPQLESLRNVNTPEEYESVCQRGMGRKVGNVGNVENVARQVTPSAPGVAPSG